MAYRLFPGDKNHILKEVQQNHREFLLYLMVEKVKNFYLSYYNPLGLVDDTIRKIQKSDQYPLEALNIFYEHLSGIYRYQFGEVQLAFLFDGRSHYEKYSEDWTAYFKQKITEFCFAPHFVKAVLEVTVLQPNDHVAQLAGNRMRNFLQNHFALKVHRYKGIQTLKAS